MNDGITLNAPVRDINAKKVANCMRSLLFCHPFLTYKFKQVDFHAAKLSLRNIFFRTILQIKLGMSCEGNCPCNVPWLVRADMKPPKCTKEETLLKAIK